MERGEVCLVGEVVGGGAEGAVGYGEEEVGCGYY